MSVLRLRSGCILRQTQDRRVVLDIDGVLADLMGSARAVFGPAVETAWAIQERYPGRGAEVTAWMHRPGTLAGLRPIPGAVKAVSALWRAGWQVVCVTARSKGLETVTLAWLEVVGFKVNDCIVAGNEKVDRIRWLAPDVAVDDSAIMVPRLRKVGVRTVVFDQPWNRHLPGERLKGWSGFRGFNRP